MIVLGTAVLAELIRPGPDARVMAWTARQRRSELCATAVGEAELLAGLALLPEGNRRGALARAVARLLGEGLGGRVLPFDRDAAAVWGQLAARLRGAGHPPAAAELQTAAIAVARGAALLATRGAAGLEGCGVPLADPWRE